MHRDEAGKDHLHYVFTFPEVPNEKYVKPQDKFFEGMRKAVEKYDLRPSQKDLQDCLSALERYEKRSDKARERETIQEIGRIFGLNRDDARWVFTRVRRLDSERFEKRLQSKDDFLTRDLFRKFHPAFQKWMDEHGFHCTVYKGGGRVNLTVDQLKKLSKATGKTFKHGISLDYLSDLIKENDRLQMRVAELERQSHTRGWGDPSGWGGSRDKEITR